MAHPLDGDDRIGIEALRALAHPLRVQLLERLGVRECATASMLARDIGESSGATSYHLRQLARHGLIVEDADRGTARERWWRRRPGGLTLAGHEFMGDPAAADTVRVVVDEIHRGMAQRLQRWLDTAMTDWPQEWLESTVDAYQNLRLNAAQLHALISELYEVIERYRAMPPGEGAAPVELQLNAFPKPEPAGAEA